MSKKWDAESDAKLMSAMMQMCDIKLNGQQYDELSKIMGVTPKAIMHRISHYRNAGKNGTSSASKSKAADAKPKATKATGYKKSKGAARTSSPDADGDCDDAGGAPTPPPSTRSKRNGAKGDYAQLAGEGEVDGENAEDDGLGKNVKIEVGEDIGEGLRQKNHFEEAMADIEVGDGDGFA